MKLAFRATTLVAIVVVCVVASATPASAHGKIVDSDPAQGESVSTSPGELQIWISEPVSASLSTVELQTVDGRSIPTNGLEVGTDGDYGKLTVFLPPLEDGTYSAAWKVLSESDGHVTRGLVVFGVGRGSVDVAAFDVPTEALPVREGVARWISLLALMFVVGACVIATIVSGSSRAAGGHRALVRWVMVWSAVGATAGVVSLFLQAAAIDTGPAGWWGLRGTAVEIATDTTWGQLWIAREVLFVVTMVTMARRLRITPSSIHTSDLCIVAGLVMTQALSGHAAGTPGQGALAVTVDAVHLTAASTWVGGLAAMIVLRRHTSASWRRFGTVAAVSVVLLISTGLYATGLQVASVDAAIDSSYGRVLLLKLLLVVGVAGLGLLNAVLVRPGLAAPLARALAREPGWTPVDRVHFPRVVAGEMAVGVAVIALTGFLTSLSPANGIEFVPSERAVAAQSQVIDDMVITLNAQPNRPGDNVLTVHAASNIRPAVAPIDRVLLRFTYQDDDLGRLTEQMEEVEPGRFRLGGSQLGRAGTWNIQTVVRRAGLPDAIATFDWVVPLAGDSEPTVSDAPLGPPLTNAAVALLAMLLFAVASSIWMSTRPRRPSAGLSQQGTPDGTTSTRHDEPVPTPARSPSSDQRELEGVGS
jgi:copper transport protein